MNLDYNNIISDFVEIKTGKEISWDTFAITHEVHMTFFFTLLAFQQNMQTFK